MKMTTATLFALGAMLGVVTVVSMSIARDNGLDTNARTIPYSGELRLGDEAYDGLADLRFTLSDEGANNWSEEHQDVDVDGGLFAVLIGAVEGEVPDWLFDAQEVYISVEVRAADDDGAGEYEALAGTQRLHPATFSYWSAEADRFLVEQALTVTGTASFTGGGTVSMGSLSSNLDMDVGGKLTLEGDTIGFGTIEAGTNAAMRINTDDGETWLEIDLGDGDREDAVVLRNTGIALAIAREGITLTEGRLKMETGASLTGGSHNFNGTLVSTYSVGVGRSTNGSRSNSISPSPGDGETMMCGLNRLEVDDSNNTSGAVRWTCRGQDLGIQAQAVGTFIFDLHCGVSCIR